MSVTGERADNKLTQAVSLLNAPIVNESDLFDPLNLINQQALSGKRRGAVVYVTRTSDGSLTTAVAQGSEPSDAWKIHTDFDASSLPVRKKIEVFYDAVSLALPTTESNLVSLLKTLTPTSGILTNFINTTSNKLNVYNDDASVTVKVNITGNWASSTDNRSMSLRFEGTNGNKLTFNRISNIIPDTLQFLTILSVDKGGNIATNGTAMMIQSFGSVFTATSILLTVEQVTAVSSITPV